MVVLAIIAGVGVPLFGNIIRSKDFKAQVDGKKPIRQLDEKNETVLRETPQKQAELESAKYIAELKSKQNFLMLK